MKRYIHYIIFITSCFPGNNLLAQDTALMHSLVQHIAEQQVKGDDFFMRGIFPSYISNNPISSTSKKDNNIFYNGLISLVLKHIYTYLPAEDKVICDSIFERQRNLFPQFKNKNGRDTYNFWRTDSAFIFPYTMWIHLLKKNAGLPDDMDDTVLSLLALDADDSIAVNAHALMQQYVNNEANPVRILLKQYSDIPAYSTWFGKKFPVVFDMCVMSNILFFVQSYNLQWTKADSASLHFIVDVLKNNNHILHNDEVAPYYGNTSIILYHIARLMSIKKIPELEALKTKLITDAVNEFANTDNIFEKIILCNSIYKWGYIPPLLSLPSLDELDKKIEKNDLSFFIGNIPSYMQDNKKKFFLKNKMGLFYHYCPAYNDALLLEYVVLRDAK